MALASKKPVLALGGFPDGLASTRQRVAGELKPRYSFRMPEPSAVRIGQRVRDLDGNLMGRVKRLYEQGFAVSKGPPILFRRDHVVRYEEVRDLKGGELIVARSRRDLFDLAAGEVPPAWRIDAPPGFSSFATPDEARAMARDPSR